MTFGGPVVLQCIQQESGALLHHILLHEDVHDLVDVSQRLLVGDKHRSKRGSLVRVGAHDRPQQVDVVGLVGDLLGVDDDLLELAGLGEALDHLDQA